MSRRRATAFVLALAVAAGGIGCRGMGAPRTGDLAPDFVLPDLDGNVQKLSNHRGKPVLVNLWATWCPPCIAEIPLLDEIVREYGPRGLVVLGIAGDDEDARVRDFVAKHSPAFKVLLDPGGTVGTMYAITGYPETFLVDRDGRLVTKFIGPVPSESGRLAQSVSTLLAGVLESSG
jgi:thiol-disulfide isomerase/thioredoxin